MKPVPEVQGEYMRQTRMLLSEKMSGRLPANVQFLARSEGAN